MNAPRPCPCGRTASFAECCGPLLAGASQAETAEALMRSRYTAYLEGAVDYLIATTAAAARGGLDRRGLVAYCRGLRGISLRILAVQGGGLLEETGVVEFAATLRARAVLTAARVGMAVFLHNRRDAYCEPGIHVQSNEESRV